MKLPPQSGEDEQALLGALLDDNGHYSLIAMLSADDFADPVHALYYSGAGRRHRQQKRRQHHPYAGGGDGNRNAGRCRIGTSSPAASVKADIAGLVKVAGTGSEPCTAAQVGSMRYNPTGNYFELCSYP
jgi:hypothetical protein